MIIYLGNALSRHGFSQAMMETLCPKLALRHQVLFYSVRKNQFLRFADIVFAVIRHRHTADLIIIDTYSTLAFWYFVAAAVVSRFFSIPYAPVLRGGDLPARVKRQAGFLNKLFSDAAINISPSQYLKRDFDRLGFKTICIPNFLEIEKYPVRHRTAVRPRLLWVRSLHRIYNPALAIQLVEALKTSYPDVTLCMVGHDKDGSLALVTELARTLGVEDKVRFTGKLSKKEWIELAFEFDIFINTTDYDNMPVSVMEAMALGLPVVSTNVGGIPDLIDNGKNGLTVPPNDVQLFAGAVRRLLEEPGLAARLTKEARLTAESFSWERVGALWDDVIDGYRKKRTL